MTKYSKENIFSTLRDFYASTNRIEGSAESKILHCVNPFPVKPGSEHDRAQRVTFASMTSARSTARLLSPHLEIRFAKVTNAQDVESELIEFDHHYSIERAVTDLRDFRVPRPLPIMMDVLTATPVQKDEIFVYTNVDIALVPGFYRFVEAVFSRGVDCAIINRRTVSGIYRNENDLKLAACEVGAPHPGFDCFAFRGHLRDALLPYDSCVGIGGVMLPLVHQLLAKAEHPVVLLDAHATYHLGDDRQWLNREFADYRKHNQMEIDRIFEALLDDPEIMDRLLNRLSGLPRGHRKSVVPRRQRAQARLKTVEQKGGRDRIDQHIMSLLQRAFFR